MGIGIRNAEFGIRNSHGKKAAETASGGHGRSESGSVGRARENLGIVSGDAFQKPVSFSRPGPVCGGLAQLGERLPCKQEVSGSNPLISTDGGR